MDTELTYYHPQRTNEQVYEDLLAAFEENGCYLVATPNPPGVGGSRVELVYPDGAHHALCGWGKDHWPGHLVYGHIERTYSEWAFSQRIDSLIGRALRQAWLARETRKKGAALLESLYEDKARDLAREAGELAGMLARGVLP